MKKYSSILLLMGFLSFIPGCGFDNSKNLSDIETESTFGTKETTPNPVVEQTVSGIKIRKIEDTYYTTVDVNLRLDCTLDSEYFTGITAGTELQSTGISENGWIEVVYEGQTCYVNGDYVTRTQLTDTTAVQ